MEKLSQGPEFIPSKGVVSVGMVLGLVIVVGAGCAVSEMGKPKNPNNCRGIQYTDVAEGESVDDVANKLQSTVLGNVYDISVALRAMNPDKTKYKEIGSKYVYYFTENGVVMAPATCSTPNPKPQN